MFHDKRFYKSLITIATPIIIQEFIMMFLNMVDVIMIGQLGEVSVAAVGLANQISFLLILLLFGITTGSSVFMAQYWGQKNIAGVRKVLGICLGIGLAGSLIFITAAFSIPESMLRIYSKDPEVIRLGGQYLSIVGFSYLPMVLTFSYSAALRSTENVKPPMFASIIALSLNTLLNYTLIFGNLGFPELGVQGAGIATVISRLLESTILLLIVYIKRTPAAARIRELINFNLEYLRTYFKTVLPVILNEVFWSLGITTYNIIYARINTASVAAVNIASTVESVAFVLFFGIGNACAIMVGNLIGSKKEDRAFLYARRSLVLTISGGFIIGLLVFISAGWIPSLYNVSEETLQYTHNILRIAGLTIWIRASNITLVLGILRSGGDTRYTLFIELVCIWGIGVPMALLGAFVLHMPVYWVYLLVQGEEIVKMILGITRLFSKKWIHDLSEPAAGVLAPP
jgi:putative MATE family efflux protein